MSVIRDNILRPLERLIFSGKSGSVRVRIREREDGRFILADAETGADAFKPVSFATYSAARCVAESYNGFEIADGKEPCR